MSSNLHYGMSNDPPDSAGLPSAWEGTPPSVTRPAHQDTAPLDAQPGAVRSTEPRQGEPDASSYFGQLAARPKIPTTGPPSEDPQYARETERPYAGPVHSEPTLAWGQSLTASPSAYPSIEPSRQSSQPSQEQRPAQPQPAQPAQQHCFKDAAGAQVCKAVGNFHHNTTDIHKDHGVNDFHNTYDQGHKENVQGIVPGTKATAAFEQPKNSGKPTLSQQHDVSGTKDGGKTAFEGHEDHSADGFRDTHEDNNHGDYEDHKEDNTHGDINYKQQSKLPDGGQAGNNLHGASDTHELSDVQDHQGSTDTLRQGKKDWDFQSDNMKKHGKNGVVAGEVPDRPIGGRPPPPAQPQQNSQADGDSSLNAHEHSHSDHIHDEHKGADGTYNLHEENNEKDSSSLVISGQSAWGDAGASWDNMDDIFNSPAFQVPADSDPPSAQQHAVRSMQPGRESNPAFDSYDKVIFVHGGHAEGAVEPVTLGVTEPSHTLALTQDLQLDVPKYPQYPSLVIASAMVGITLCIVAAVCALAWLFHGRKTDSRKESNRQAHRYEDVETASCKGYMSQK